MLVHLKKIAAPARHGVLAALVPLKVLVVLALLEVLAESALLKVCWPGADQGDHCAVAGAAQGVCGTGAVRDACCASAALGARGAGAA